jgi:phosphate-selective porin OprO and OprP
MKRLGFRVLLLMAVLAGAARPVAAQDPADTTTAARIERLEQQILVAERLREIWLDSVKAAQATAAVVTAGPGGFSIRSADNAFSLRIRGLVQGDGRFFMGDSARPTSNGFLLRRVRPSLEATFGKNYSLRLVPDFAGSVLVLQDAYLDSRFSGAIQVRGGRFKAPFGLERLGTASDFLFIERGYPTSVAPNRDVGLQLGGDIRFINYALGVFNGVVDGGSADTDLNDDKDLVGRLMILPFRANPRHSLAGLGFGIAGSYGNQIGSATTSALPSYRTAGQQTFFGYRTGVFADGRRTRVGPQAHFYSGRFGLMAEHYTSKQRVTLPGATETIEVKAWQVAGSLMLFGGTAQGRVVTPKTSFDVKAGTWGALEVAARYGQLEINDAAFPVFADSLTQAGEAKGFGLGLNWYLNRNVRISASYEETTFVGGAATGDREKEKVLFTRMQFAY